MNSYILPGRYVERYECYLEDAGSRQAFELILPRVNMQKLLTHLSPFFLGTSNQPVSRVKQGSASLIFDGASIAFYSVTDGTKELPHRFASLAPPKVEETRGIGWTVAVYAGTWNRKKTLAEQLNQALSDEMKEQATSLREKEKRSWLNIFDAAVLGIQTASAKAH